MKIRNELAPYLAGYEEKFTSKGEIRWLPHLLFFHPQSHRSDVVNTDSIGFRYATDGGRNYSVADQGDADSVRLLAGSSTVFGIGASSDAWTLPSRLNAHDDRPGTWLNFGGRSFNSTQELLLLTLYRHLLPKVDEIVLFSGFNNLSLARMPQMREEDHGTFFQYTTYQDIFAQHAKTKSSMRGLLRRQKEAPAPAAPSIDEQLAYAADLTLRHLSGWKALASTWDAKITYILQPLSGWVRDKGSREEELIFDELEQHGGFAAMYGDILSRQVNIDYAAMLEQGAKEMGIDFVNFSPVLAESAQQDQWLFIDRIHLTDHGHDFVASKVLENI
ncbi:SGNH/GDSL hydrolase family protein [Streptomyces noursei]|uniref:SGNH/GDSL hydrolase family protein n=1 Tax=Streptomyces TaxID=1883 RepID=UPI0005C8996A|nr:SGNH/GDSL hydrolase family protein [Streptomyces noursei]MCE4946270.1 SGNH/GDSL hydrolase family protein [Streptomyces noursei]